MPLIKYVGNANPGDGATRILLARDEHNQERALVLGGEPLEVTDEEFGRLFGSFQIEKIGDDEEESPKPLGTDSFPPVTPSAPKFSTITTAPAGS